MKNMYTTNEYIEKHPTYDVEHSPWKAKEIIKILKNDYPNYFKVLIYNYGKFLFFSLPFSQILFGRFLQFKKRKVI